MTTFPCFIFGVLGNVVSFMVYLAPLPTFYRIYNKKSTEGFQSVPYMVSLFSSMLWMYYALIKTHAPLLISINGFGCFIQTIYIAIYMRYAPRKARILTVKMLLLFNLGVFSLLFLLTFLLWKGSNRVHILGWVCVAFSVAVFAAPLSIMKLVITTKSVEFMPLSLSFFLTLSAIMWFLHGLLQNDKYIAIPNVVGFFLGLLQILLYGIYRDTNEVKETEKQLPEPIGFGLGLLQMLLNGIYRDTKEIKEMEKLPERIVDVIRVRAMGSADVHLVNIQPNHDQKKIGADQKVDEQTSKSEKSMGVQTEIQQNELEV